jgi:hypothetical protein
MPSYASYKPRATWLISDTFFRTIAVENPTVAARQALDLHALPVVPPLQFLPSQTGPITHMPAMQVSWT